MNAQEAARILDRLSIECIAKAAELQIDTAGSI